MPRARRPPPDRPARAIPLPRAGRQTPEQLAKVSVAKRPRPPGQPDKAEIVLRLVLQRKTLERLTARAIEQQRQLEALAAEIIEQAAE